MDGCRPTTGYSQLGRPTYSYWEEKDVLPCFVLGVASM